MHHYFTIIRKRKERKKGKKEIKENPSFSARQSGLHAERRGTSRLQESHLWLTLQLFMHIIRIRPIAWVPY